MPHETEQAFLLEFSGVRLKGLYSTWHDITSRAGEAAWLLWEAAQTRVSYCKVYARFIDACLERVYTSAGPPVGDQASDQP